MPPANNIAVDLDRLCKAVDILREADPTMPMQVARILLAVAEQPGITYPELVKISGVTLAAVSRNVAYLAAFFRGAPGLGLVEAINDPHNLKRHAVFLTPKGRKVVTKALSAATGKSVDFETTDARTYVNEAYEEKTAAE